MANMIAAMQMITPTHPKIASGQDIGIQYVGVAARTSIVFIVEFRAVT
jgi:hypothetical protein